MRISPTPCSSDSIMGRAHSLNLDDTGHRHYLVAAHDERPAFTVRTRDLGVDKYVLDLLRAPRQPVTGTPPPYFKARHGRRNTPWPPLDQPCELHRAALEPQPVVFPHRLDAAAE